MALPQSDAFLSNIECYVTERFIWKEPGYEPRGFFVAGSFHQLNPPRASFTMFEGQNIGALDL